MLKLAREEVKREKKQVPHPVRCGSMWKLLALRSAAPETIQEERKRARRVFGAGSGRRRALGMAVADGGCVDGSWSATGREGRGRRMGGWTAEKQAAARWMHCRCVVVDVPFPIAIAPVLYMPLPPGRRSFAASMATRGRQYFQPGQRFFLESERKAGRTLT